MTAAGCFWAMTINDRPGEAGERNEPQAANGPEGESPIEQVERARWPSLTASRACGRAYITAQRIRYLGTWVGGSTRASVVGFLDPMTSPGTPLSPRVADVVHRCSSVVEPGIFILASSCGRIGSPPTDVMPQYVSQARVFPYVARGVLFSGWPPLNDARALMHVSAPAAAMQRRGWGFPAFS